MTEHYYSKKPSARERPRVLSLNVNGKDLVFHTSSAMFSPRRIDRASLLLIENMKLGKVILDMGAGYGAIGICAAVIKPDSTVILAEINERAAGLARKNIAENTIPNAKVVESDFFEEIDGKFDTIVLNPPMALGLRRLYSLISDCKEHLAGGGSLQMVARHKKGGSRLMEKMREVFGNVDCLAKGGGFRVYMSSVSK